MAITKQISIRLDETVLAEVDAEALRLGVSRNLVISRRVEKLPPLYSVDRESGVISIVPENGESRKKIADDLAGVVGENPACAPMGKSELGESEAELSDEGMEILYGRTGDTSNFGAIVVPVQKKIAREKPVPNIQPLPDKQAALDKLRGLVAGIENNVLISPTMGADGNFTDAEWSKDIVDSPGFGGVEVDLCWRKEYNPDTGQTGACGLEKGHKGKCGAWEVVE